MEKHCSWMATVLQGIDGLQRERELERERERYRDREMTPNLWNCWGLIRSHDLRRNFKLGDR